jgi:hypothetical protein
VANILQVTRNEQIRPQDTGHTGSRRYPSKSGKTHRLNQINEIGGAQVAFHLKITCSQEILEGVLDPLVKRYTRNEFMSILDRFRTALHAKEYSTLVECYVA